MEARNRDIKDWYGKTKRGEIKLPRFQRHEAWDKHRISSLIETVIQNLPLGITLILEVGDKEKFISRNLETAPDSTERVTEHLLDGQQRLTALWRVFHNNYDSETYYVRIKELIETEDNPNQPMYEVIDGQQRIRAIYDFVDGNIVMPEENAVYELPEGTFDIGGKKYTDEDFPQEVKDALNSFIITINL